MTRPRPTLARLTLAAVLGGLGVVAAGACQPTVTSLEVDVTYDPALALDQLTVTIAKKGGAPLAPVKAPATPAPLTSGDDSAGFLLPDDLAGVDISIAVDGTSAGAVVAHGASTVATKLGSLVHATVALTALGACGDGGVGPGEACDDGNADDGDGCSASCAVELGFTCSGSPSVCGQCGDGVVAGGEACDDGNFTDGDGCSSSCTVDPGFSCSGSPSACSAACGDGIVAGAEGCDDGNSVDGDGCSASCAVEDGYACSGTPSACAPVCGDGLVTADEPCDDGNPGDGDGCSSSCTVEAGFSCDGASPTVCAPICGDGIVAGGEQCDDGTDPVTGNSDTRPDACRTDCTSAGCGDGVTDAGEDCDDGNADARDGCSPSCRAPFCGDGFVDAAGEDCDDGNGADGDGCSSSCAVEAGFVCGGPAPTTCTASGIAHEVTPGVNAITTALASASAGDFLFLRAGNYDEAVTVNTDVTIVADAGAVLTSSSNAQATLAVSRDHAVTVIGLDIEATGNKSAVFLASQGAHTSSANLVACTLGPSHRHGVESSNNTTVVMRRCLVAGNDDAGVTLSGDFTIENSFLVDNGAAGSAAGGADLRHSGAVSFTTVTGNTGLVGGVACAQAGTAVTSSILFGNGGADQAGCDVSGSDVGGDPAFAADGFHLSAASPFLDAADPASCPAVDFDLDPRPFGAGCAFGADEGP